MRLFEAIGRASAEAPMARLVAEALDHHETEGQ